MTGKWIIPVLGAAAIAMSGDTANADVIIDLPVGGVASIATQQGTLGNPDQSAWFGLDTGEMVTCWADQTLTYSFDAGAPGQKAFGVTAKNFWGPLPNTYSTFDIAVSVDGTYVDTVHIAASDTQWNTGWVNIGVRGGPVTITVKWLNDAWEPGIADANIGVGAVSLASVPSAGSISLASLGLLLSGTRRRR